MLFLCLCDIVLKVSPCGHNMISLRVFVIAELKAMSRLRGKALWPGTPRNFIPPFSLPGSPAAFNNIAVKGSAVCSVAKEPRREDFLSWYVSGTLLYLLLVSCCSVNRHPFSECTMVYIREPKQSGHCINPCPWLRDWALRHAPQ